MFVRGIYCIPYYQEYITLKQRSIPSRIIEIKIGGGGLPRNQK